MSHGRGRGFEEREEQSTNVAHRPKRGSVFHRLAKAMQQVVNIPLMVTAFSLALGQWTLLWKVER
jgi:hypothetical protein